MRPLLPLILAALCAAPARAEVHEVVSVAQAPPIEIPRATHRIPVHVVILRGSPWTWAIVEQRVTKMKEVIAQCGVRIDATIVELAPPAKTAAVIYEPARSSEPNGMATITQFLAQPKPTLFYIGGFPDNPSQGGTARTRQSAVGQRSVPEVDTAWIPHFESPPIEHSNYSVDAHELVHVMGDMEHWTPPYQSPPGFVKGDVDPNRPDPGLMVRMPMIRTNILHPYACDRIKKFPRATPL